MGNPCNCETVKKPWNFCPWCGKKNHWLGTEKLSPPKQKEKPKQKRNTPGFCRICGGKAYSRTGKYCGEHFPTPRNQKIIPEQYKEIWDAFVLGETMISLAKKHKVSVATIRYALRRFQRRGLGREWMDIWYKSLSEARQIFLERRKHDQSGHI